MPHELVKPCPTCSWLIMSWHRQCIRCEIMFPVKPGSIAAPA